MQGRLSSHCRHHAPPMQRIEIRTFRQILERNHELACFCPGCRRWATCNLAELVANGLGDYDPRNCRPKCRKCGSVSEWQLRPSLPSFDGFGRNGMHWLIAHEHDYDSVELE